MTLFSFVGLAAAMFVLAITPGPGVFATVSKALAHGFRQAVPVVLGIIIGDLIFLLFAIYGLSAMAETFGTFFAMVKYLGGVYLVWLGIKLWRTTPDTQDVANLKRPSGKYSFLGGLSITLGNPKVILFYLGFLPTFVALDTLSILDITLISLVVSFILGSVMLCYAFSASRARRLFQSRTARGNMNKTAGTVMIGTGFVLLSKS